MTKRVSFEQMFAAAFGPDKSKWGPGPWQNEPDLAEWEHAGLPCQAVRSIGHWCGYVAVPPGHMLYRVHYADYDRIKVDVHGGLTYSSAAVDHIRPPGPTDVWWFGFDCNHSFDYSPFMAQHCYAREGQEYRTLAYVTNETNRLAEQLADMKPLPERDISFSDDPV